MPNGTIDPSKDYVGELASKKATNWAAIKAAQKEAEAVKQLLLAKLSAFTSGDVDLVVFGSLARGEWTSGSDVDWTILIDGQADTQHRVSSRRIGEILAGLTYRGKKLEGPGAEGIFGNMAFSHEIVHHIGGQADTNRNTTQRILLLLEATALQPAGEMQDGPFERILRQILNRYLMSDSNFHVQADTESRIPRFLLNDVVRYWRTMCVDFAYKDWEQAGKKWALRNIKLRMSRKLLFIGGLFTVFSCFKNEDLRRDTEDSNQYRLKLQKHLLNFVHSTPLNIVAWTLSNIGLDDKCCQLLDEYDQFVAQVNDETVRKHLEGISEDDVYEDETFLKCRGISHKFQKVLQSVCFEDDATLKDFMIEYGVF